MGFVTGDYHIYIWKDLSSYSSALIYADDSMKKKKQPQGDMNGLMVAND